mmetsp:Transcript_6419/g.13661  ORF Transcript_6419/g.13661 Transcript_6419/m.13661 type:complete len:324 (+) Transcript_6419:167-1138(+)|eukprot:CAMPEP_0168299128 /NCGR_PEP_ID=MMETSP0142_2-20121227/25552_1 /TAXON_ID=44445 /ORGANISM="Pseudo-nitzschia australis, Strain 10249 10 AB" /LENGTH=323 /DNA_ID=CAMNT_0008248731 /DNA_START=112 /DNA_END=1083 /DNA_ORIENTATION=+
MPSALSGATHGSTDLDRRLSVLESRVGISHRNTDTKTHGRDINSSSKNNNKNIDSVDDRLAKIRVDLEGKISSSSIEATPSNINVNSNANINISQNEQSWKEIQKLLGELDPGIALTHQQQPLLYKRQQVLASSDELFKDFAELDLILKLLLTGTKTNGNEAKSSSTIASNANDLVAGKNKRGGAGTSTSVTDASTTTKAGQPSSSAIEKQKQQQAKKEQESQQQKQRSDGGQTSIRVDQVTQAPILTQHMGTNATRPEDQKRVEDLRLKFLDLHNRTTALAQILRRNLECYHTVTTAVSEKIVLADERISMVTEAKKAAAAV